MKPPAERLLVLLLRALAVVELVALVAVVMPREWMGAGHRFIGLGGLPEGPVVGYLARITSWLYAVHGALVLLVSFDVRRYGPVIAFLALANVAQGVAVIAVGVAEGMPWLWTFGDGLGAVGIGVVLFLLQRRCAALLPPYSGGQGKP
jgi:hypothetical protein